MATDADVRRCEGCGGWTWATRRSCASCRQGDAVEAVLEAVAALHTPWEPIPLPQDPQEPRRAWNRDRMRRNRAQDRAHRGATPTRLDRWVTQQHPTPLARPTPRGGN